MELFNTVILWVRLHSVIAMIAVFALLVITTYWPSRKAEFERDSMIPLRDDR